MKFTEERFQKTKKSNEPGPGSYGLSHEKRIQTKKKKLNKLTESIVKFVRDQ